MMDDNAIMFNVQNGQIDQLAELFERNHVPLYRYFIRMGHSESHSEDLVQETFMKVLTYKHSFKGDAGFRAWLYGIARNTGMDQFRQAQRYPNSVDPVSLELVSKASLQEETEQQQQRDHFSTALRQLPVELKEILVLHRYQQLSYEDIASLIGCNLNTLKSKMRKAVSELHKHYASLMGEQLQ
jgi:RNA polymerase sigma-70 factor (ECF subfamily)